MGTLEGNVNVLFLIAVGIFVGVPAQLNELPRMCRSNEYIYYINSFLNKIDKKITSEQKGRSKQCHIKQT